MTGAKNRMNIKEVEERTGISRQNIRYYEKQGLLHPERNLENDYRVYGEAEISRLNEIKLFRKLGISIEEIRRMLDGELELGTVLEMQKEKLEREKAQLEGALRFCERIRERELDQLQAEQYLEEIEKEEKNGALFADFLSDYKAMARAEAKRTFTFMPDSMCLNKKEFTEALLAYAAENNLNLVITKEGMFPEFTIDGIEYTAYRANGRYGASVTCEMVNTEDYMPKGMSEKKYKWLRRLRTALVPVGLFFLITLLYGFQTGDFVLAVVLGISEVSIFVATLFPYRNLEE